MPRLDTAQQNDSDVIEESDVREPRMFRVFLHNDDYTSMEFVVSVLIETFHKSQDEATRLMLLVHEKGMAQCGVYTHEIAESKVGDVHTKARRAGFPLRCTMEEV